VISFGKAYGITLYPPACQINYPEEL
jgi:hypothetical protein